MDREDREDRDLRRDANEWMARHPEAFRLFERFALQAVARQRRFAIKLLVERVRWEHHVERDEEFKINNNYPAYIIRRIIELHPEVDRYVERRRVRY